MWLAVSAAGLSLHIRTSPGGEPSMEHKHGSLLISLLGSKTVALIGLPMVGFFASVMWSIIISLALNSVSSHHGSFSGILVTGIAGGAIIPLIVGWLGDQFGLRFGMFFLFVTLAYILSIGFWSKPLINNEIISLKKSQ